MSVLDEGSKRGYVCHYRDGKKVTNLTYLESLELFNEDLETANPCSITPPGYGEKESF